MIRSILRSLIFLLFSTVAIAQSTTVSATVVDSDSTAWANGTWSISFVPSQSFPNLSSYTCNGSALTTSYKGTLNGSGAFSQAMCTGSSTAPGGGSWNISICPNSSAPCGLLNFTTAGSTLDLSSAITAVIPAPRFAAVAGAYGYADVEAALSLRPGGTYFNVTTPCQEVYNGSSWSCVGNVLLNTCDASTVPLYGQAVCITTITSAQILAMDGSSATAIQLIAAPGVGRVIIPNTVSASAEYIFNTTPYSDTTILIASWGTVVSDADALNCTVDTSQSTNQEAIGCNSASGDFLPSSEVANTAYSVFNVNGPITDGDGTIIIDVPYSVHPIQ